MRFKPNNTNNSDYLGYITDTYTPFKLFINKKSVKNPIKSLAGIFLLPKSLFSFDAILTDKEFQTLIEVYKTFTFQSDEIELRKKLVNAINHLLEKRNKERFNRVLEEFVSKRPLEEDQSIEEEDLESLFYGEKKEAYIRRKPLEVFNSKEGGKDVDFLMVEIPIEGRDYLFSEGTKLKAFKEVLKVCGLEPYLKEVERLEILFDAEIVSFALNKLSPVEPVFMKTEGNKAFYFLRLRNYDYKKKFFKSYESLKGNYKKWIAELPEDCRTFATKLVKKLLEKFEENRYGSVDALIDTVYAYIIVRVFLKLVQKGNIKCNSEGFLKLKKEFSKLKAMYKKVIFKPKEKLLEHIVKSGSQKENFKLLKWALNEKELNLSGNKKISVGKSLFLYHGFTRKHTQSFEELLQQMDIYAKERLPLKQVFPFKLESAGEILDAVLIANALKEKFNALWLFINEKQIDSDFYKRLKAILNFLLPNQTVSSRALEKPFHSLKNALLSSQKIYKEATFEGLNFEPTLVIVEDAISNRLMEVVHSKYLNDNVKTAHRFFRIYLAHEDKLSEVNLAYAIAGNSENCPLFLSKKQTFKVKKVLFITTSNLSQKDVENFTQRLVGSVEVKRIFKSDRGTILSEGKTLKGKLLRIYDEKEKVLLFVHPTPPIFQRLSHINQTGYAYENVDKEDIDILTALHSLHSDSIFLPFSQLKEEKLTKLGKIEVYKGGTAYISVALLELLARLSSLQGKIVAPLKDTLNTFEEGEFLPMEKSVADFEIEEDEEET